MVDNFEARKKMNEPKINIDHITNSILYVRASGSIEDVSADLQSEPIKTIAQLLHEKTTEVIENKAQE
jgi:hypothetical protein